MFEFVETLTVRRKVTVQKPSENEGYTAMECHVTWKINSISEENQVTFTPEFFDSVITNIEGPVNAETKQPIPFTEDFKKKFTRVPYILSGLTKEYLACTHTAARGN